MSSQFQNYLDYLYEKAVDKAAADAELFSWGRLLKCMKEVQQANPPVGVETGVDIVVRLADQTQCRLGVTSAPTYGNDNYEISLSVPPTAKPLPDQKSFGF